MGVLYIGNRGRLRHISRSRLGHNSFINLGFFISYNYYPVLGLGVFEANGFISKKFRTGDLRLYGNYGRFHLYHPGGTENEIPPTPVVIAGDGDEVSILGRYSRLLFPSHHH